MTKLMKIVKPQMDCFKTISENLTVLKGLNISLKPALKGHKISAQLALKRHNECPERA